MATPFITNAQADQKIQTAFNDLDSNKAEKSPNDDKIYGQRNGELIEVVTGTGGGNVNSVNGKSPDPVTKNVSLTLDDLPKTSTKETVSPTEKNNWNNKLEKSPNDDTIYVQKNGENLALDMSVIGSGIVKKVNSKNPNLAGEVVLNKTDISLGEVDNTSDANKPLSNAALDSMALLQSTVEKSLNINEDPTSTSKYPSNKAVVDYVAPFSTGSNLGLLKTTDTPPPTGTHKGDVNSAGTYTNFKTAAAVSIVFTALELVDNFGYIYVKENVSEKSLVSKKGGDVTLAQLNTKLDKIQGKNLADPSKFREDFYIFSSGNEMASTQYRVTDFIPIVEGQSLISNQLTTGAYNQQYDSAKVKIAGTVVPANTAVVGVANAKYAKFSIRKEVALPQVEVGTERTTPENFTESLGIDNKIKVVDDKVVSFAGNMYFEGYTFTPETVTGRTVPLTGIVYSFAGGKTSKIIPTNNATKVKLKGNGTLASAHTVLYNKFGNVARVVVSKEEGLEIDIREDEKYFLVGVPLANNLSVTILKTNKNLNLDVTPRISNRNYVSVTGSDDLGDGSYDNPYATIKKATLGVSYGGAVVVKNGTYWNPSMFHKEGVELKGESKEGTILIRGQKITEAESVSGYTKVLKSISPYVNKVSIINIFQYNTADERTLILDDERLQVHGRHDHRCPITNKMKRVTSLALVESTEEPTFFYDGTDLFFSIKTGTNLTDNPIFAPQFEKEAINSDLNISNITLLGIGYAVQSKTTTLRSVNIGCVNSSHLYCSGGQMNLYDVNSFQSQNDGSGGGVYGNIKEYNSWFHDNDDEGSSCHEETVVRRKSSVYEYNASSGVVDVHSTTTYIEACYFQGNVGGSCTFSPIALAGYKNRLTARIVNSIMQDEVFNLGASSKIKYINCVWKDA